MTRTLNSGKGETLDTALTDEQAVTCCRKFKGNKFAQELVAKWDVYQRRAHAGRRAWPLSEAQLYWLHKFALEGENPRPSETPGDLAPIVRLFRAVDGAIRFPKIKLLLPADPARPRGPYQPLALGWASGATAKYPNTINVTDGAPFGRNVWYGRVLPGGEFHRSRHCPDPVLYLLRRFAQDPVGTAREHGRLHRQCCFCASELTDERSLHMGYGPVCAVHYHLPWGDDPRVDSWLTATPGAVVAAQEPGRPLFDDPRVQAEYERLLNSGVAPALAEERAFDPLIAEADRLDQERADSQN